MPTTDLAEIQPFYEMDRRDELQILQALEGQVVQDLVYKVEGKTGLSYTGVNYMCFKMGHIKVDPDSLRIEYDEREDEYTAYAVAINEKYNLSAAGVAVQPRMMDVHVKDDKGSWVKNPDGTWKMRSEKDRFAKTKAMSKAQRNGKRAVIPEPLLAKYLEYFLAVQEGKDVPPPSFTDADLDKPPAKKPTDAKQYPTKEEVKEMAQRDREELERQKTERGQPVVPPEEASQYGEPPLPKLPSRAIPIYDALEGAETAVHMLKFVDKTTHLEIHPDKFLGDQWGPIMDILRNQFNGIWVKAGKESHWEIK